MVADFCTDCGGALRSGGLFCVSCGASLPRPEEPDSSMRDAAIDGDDDVTTVRPFGGAPSNSADRFQIRAVLGDGHAGTLFRAYDRDLGRLVTLRLLDSAIAGDPVRFARVQDAVRRMAGIVDPNIVEIYSLIDDAVPPVVVSECVDGPSLGQLIATTGAVSAKVGLVVLDGTLAGLEHLHAIGMAHGCLTPSSVMVDARGFSKIADVGFQYFQPVSKLARPFLAPEVLAGQRPAAGSDIFSAGALLCLLVTGRPPMIATGSGGAGAGGPLGIAALPTAVRQLIIDAMAADPAARLGDLTTFRERLEVAAADSFGSDWRRVGTAALAGAAAVALASTAIPDAMTAATALFTAAQATVGGATVAPVAVTAATVASAGPGSGGLIPGFLAEPMPAATGLRAAAPSTALPAASSVGAGPGASGGILAGIGAHPVAAGIVAAVVVAGGATAAYVGTRGGPSAAPAPVASASPTVAPLATAGATPAASPSVSTPTTVAATMVPVCRGISNCKVVAANVDVDGDGRPDQVGINKAGTSGPTGDAGYINWTVRVSTAAGQQASITKPANSTPLGRSDMTPRDYTPWFGATNLDGRPGQELVTRNGDYEAFSTWVFAWNSGALVVLPAPISPEPAPFAGSWYVYNFRSPMYDKKFSCNADGTVSVLTDASEGANGGNWSATPYRWTGSSWDQVGQARHISSPVRQMAFDCRGLPRDV